MFFSLLADAVRATSAPHDVAGAVEALVTTATGSLSGVLRAYTQAGRTSGHDAHLGTAADPIRAAVPGLTCEAWSRADLIRITLLAARAAHLGVPEGRQAALACLEAADAAEQASWLRAVCLLDESDTYAPFVIDACRTNVLPVFCAVAVGNPYPGLHFPERNFNQMILKALFNQVPLAGVVGLAQRRNPELARMASDYADERRAAGRTVPTDIGLAL